MNTDKKIIALAVVVGIILGVGGYKLYQEATSDYVYDDNKPALVVPVGQTADWKTYKNEQFGLEFRYPATLTLPTPDTTSKFPNEIGIINGEGVNFAVDYYATRGQALRDGVSDTDNLYAVTKIDSQSNRAVIFNLFVQDSSQKAQLKPLVDQVIATFRFLPMISAASSDHQKPYATRSDGSVLDFPLTPINELYKLSDLHRVSSATVQGWVEEVNYTSVGGQILLSNRMGDFVRADIAHADISGYVDTISKLKRGDKIEIFGTNIFVSNNGEVSLGLTGEIQVLFSSGGPIETKDWQTYRNNQYGFELRYPLTWKISSTPLSVPLPSFDKRLAEYEVFNTNPPPGPDTLSITISSDSVEDVVAVQKRIHNSAADQLISLGDVPMFGGSAVKLVYRQTAVGTVTEEYIVGASKGVLLIQGPTTFDTHPEWNLDAEVVQQMINTLKIF